MESCIHSNDQEIGVDELGQIFWCPRCGRVKCGDRGEMTPSLIQLDLSEQIYVYSSREYYWVNASRGFSIDFLFPEYETFDELVYGINLLVAMGYEINFVSLYTPDADMSEKVE